jgi:hypothetical protein
MQGTRRPRALLALLAFFLWVEGRSLLFVFFPQVSSSYQFFTLLGAGWAHFALGIVTAALAITTIGFLWRPVSGWFLAASVGLAFYAAQLVFGAALMAANPEVTRQATIAMRAARGMPERGDQIALATSATSIWTSASLLLAILLILALSAWRHREYES